MADLWFRTLAAVVADRYLMMRLVNEGQNGAKLASALRSGWWIGG